MVERFPSGSVSLSLCCVQTTLAELLKKLLNLSICRMAIVNSIHIFSNQFVIAKACRADAAFVWQSRFPQRVLKSTSTYLLGVAELCELAYIVNVHLDGT